MYQISRNYLTGFVEFAWPKFPNFICWNFYKNLFLTPFSTFFRWIDPTSLDDHLCGLLAWKNTAKAIRFVFFFFHLSTHSVRFYTSRYYILKTTIIFLVKWNCSLVLFVHFVYVSKCLQNGSFQKKKNKKELRRTVSFASLTNYWFFFFLRTMLRLHNFLSGNFRILRYLNWIYDCRLGMAAVCLQFHERIS